MAILEKRKAVNQLPRFERYQDTRGGDRAAALRGETPITSAVRQLAGSSGYGPMGDSQGFSPMGGRPADGGARAPSNVTSTLAGVPARASAKASVRPTGAAATTAKSLTAAGTGAATAQKPTSLTAAGSGTGAPVTNKAGNQSTASSLGKTITNALTGAAVGAGAKTLIDKLTSTTKKPAAVDSTSKIVDTAKQVVTPSKTTPAVVTTPKTTPTSVTTPKTTPTAVTTPSVTSKVTPTATTPVVSGPKTVTTTGPKTVTGTAPKTTTTAPKIPTTGSKTPTSSTPTRGLAGAAGVVAGATGADTTATPTTGVAYDDEGNLMPGYELDENGDPVFVGDTNTTTTYNPDGTISTGAVVDGTDTLGDNQFVDAEGNIYDGDGNLVQYADGSTPDDGTDTGTDTGTDVAYTDDYGNTYDATGNLIAEADHSDYVYTADDGSTYDWNGNLIAEADHSDFTQQDDYGNTYDWNGNLIAEADHSDFTQQDDYGNTYDWNGNLIAYADGQDPSDYTGGDDTVVASGDDYSSPYYRSLYGGDGSDGSDGGDSGGGIDFGAKGGLFSMANGGSVDEPVHEKQNKDGTITQMFDDGSHITYNNGGEVIRVSEGDHVNKLAGGGQPYGPVTTASNYQNSGKLLGASQSPLQEFLNGLPQEGADSAPSDIPEGQGTGLDFAPEGWPDGYVDNGDGTATRVEDDGSTVTIDADSNIIYATDPNGEVIQDNQSVVQNNAPTGGLTQANQGTQYFDDGSYIETYDDGSSVTFDADGKPFSSTDIDGNTEVAKTTTIDDEGNRMVTDYYGNVVQVTDPNGNIIPLGGGRVNATPITGAGGSGGVSTTKPLTGGQKKTQAADDAATTAAESDWLKKLTGGLGGYGGSALAGAVLGGLLGNEDLFGGNATPSQSIDMSKVGVLNPRTTDFGIGPANYVGYDQYGTPEAMPELYGNELYQNLNAPGFNEVNPGDYAKMDAQMAPQYYDNENTEVAPDNENVEGMADGGQPQGGLGGMQTYYTFGTPVDPLQNLYNPQPAQQQAPQGMPPQAAQNQQQMASSQPVQGLPPGMPQGAPQGQNMGMAKPPVAQQNPMQYGPQGLKSGGLPAWSNVPMTAGRLNFRDGAPVHGAGDGQSDDIPAMLADGEYVIDAETVAQIGNGSTKAGAQALDKFRENIRAHKRSAPVHKIPPKTKALTSYLRGAK